MPTACVDTPWCYPSMGHDRRSGQGQGQGTAKHGALQAEIRDPPPRISENLILGDGEGGAGVPLFEAGGGGGGTPLIGWTMAIVGTVLCGACMSDFPRLVRGWCTSCVQYGCTEGGGGTPSLR